MNTKNTLLLIVLVMVNLSSSFAQIPWSLVDAPELNCDWQSVTYGNGTFVAVAQQTGTNRIMTSPDGLSWTGHTAPAGSLWKDITFANGLFVAVGGGGLMTSPDGVNWTSQPSVTKPFSAVTYGNGLFVAVREAAYEVLGLRVMTSPDGINWTAQTAPVGDWKDVAYGNGLFVALAPKAMMTSPDGINWTEVTISAGTFQLWYSVAYGNGTWVAVGGASSGNNNVMTSTDGANWSYSSAGSGSMADGALSIAFGGGTFVAVGLAYSSHNGIWSSTDGTAWTYQDNPAPLTDSNYFFNAITYGNGHFVAVSQSSPTSYNTQKILVSDVQTGIEKHSKELVFDIYPNPTSENMIISNVPSGSTIKITDITGKTRYNSVIRNKQTTINTSNFVNGIYVIQVENNGSVAIRKLVINK